MADPVARPRIYDLLIVGAGPVGLLAALGAHKRSCKNIAVIDQARDFQRAGEIVDLQPNGMHVLRIMVPAVAEELRAQSFPPSTKPVPIVDVDGTLVDELAFMTGSGEMQVSMLWSNLRKALLDGMPADVEIMTQLQLLDLEHVTVEGGEVVRASCVQNRMRVNPFVNWSNDPAAVGVDSDGDGAVAGDAPQTKTLFAKIVIGADGINSVCRSVVYRHIGGEAWENVAKPEYTGFMTFKGKGSLEEADAPAIRAEIDRFFQSKTSGLVYCRKGDSRLGSPRAIVARMPEELVDKIGFEWLFLVQFAVEQQLAHREASCGGHAALYARAMSALQVADFPECVQKLARVFLAEADDTVTARPLYVVPVDHPPPFERLQTASELPDFPEGFYRPFGHGRIFLAGDSLHAGPRSPEQGMSMGFEDCCEVVDVLAKAHGWGSDAPMHPGREALQEVLQNYRSARIERLSRVQKWTMNMLQAHNTEERQTIRQEILNFVPEADGW